MLVSLARTAALRTNPYWPFSWINRAIYRVAANAFARMCSSHPTITASYVRNSVASGNWTPGSSDIDVTVVINPGLPLEREYSFLKSFWVDFDRLKCRFPMLGEVDILDSEQLACWLCHSDRSATAPAWQLLGGRDVLAEIPFGQSPRWHVRALKEALWFYMERFVPSLSAPDEFLQRIDIQRVARKIFRLTACVTDERQPTEADVTLDRGELLAAVLASLDRAVAGAVPSSGSGDGVDGTLHRYLGRTLVILREGLDTAALLRTPQTERVLRTGTGTNPIFLTPRLFGFLVRCYDPLLYGYWEKEPAVALAVDPWRRAVAPAAADYSDAILDQLPNVLLYPRSRGLVSVNSPISVTEMTVSVRRMIRILLVQRGSLTLQDYRDLLPLGRLTYPEVFQEFDRLQARLFAGDEQEARWEMYQYFQGLAAMVLRGMVEQR